jgi:endonuclease V-like protein UPF0215 family
MTRPIANVIGFDDGPFDRRSHRGDVLVVGAVCARTRLDGVVSGRVRRDGRNATTCMAALLAGSQFDRHVRAILLNGIAVAGFNVVDIHGLAAATGRPVVVVARHPPDMAAIRRALTHVPGGDRKWALIVGAGPMESSGPLWIQRAGISLDATRAMLAATTLHGHLPEPLRLAHLIAGGIAAGKSRGRA